MSREERAKCRGGRRGPRWSEEEGHRAARGGSLTTCSFYHPESGNRCRQTVYCETVGCARGMLARAKEDASDALPLLLQAQGH